MQTIKEKLKDEIIIKNSKFITLLFNINNEEDVSNILDTLKKEYKKATHYCYAYIINNIKRSNDDGEPSGTAGMPILNVLEKNELTNILCVVIRYFGGIKLGAGGLIRAYGKSVRECLNNVELRPIISGYELSFETDYNLSSQINSILNNYTILSKIFDDKIKYNIFIESDADIILTKLKELNIKYNIEKKDVY
jgi:uncharacterized YigZ family protein